MQAVSHLLGWGGIFVNINAKNLEGKTALDILEGQRRQGVDNSEMGVILESAGALTASSLLTVTSPHAHYLSEVATPEAETVVKEPLSDEKRNALLVVAALLVTVTYQAAITPPGGLWQDDLFALNTTDVLRRNADDLYKLNITAPHRAGSAVARKTRRFATFVVSNSAIFYFSILAMVALVPPGPGVGIPLALFSLVLILSYSCSMGTITEGSDQSAIAYFSIPIIFFTVMIVTTIAVTGSVYLLNLKRKEEVKKKYSRA